MSTIQYSIVTPYSQAQMFALVNDIGKYKEFVPNCADSYVEETPKGVFGTIVLAAGIKKESFTTRNTLIGHEKIEMTLASGAFNALEGYWSFESYGDGCKVSIYLDYELPFLYRPLDGYFRSTITGLVNAFQNRAKAIYGAKAEV